MISKTESGRVLKEIPGSGSGSGTRWALALRVAANRSVLEKVGLNPGGGFHNHNFFLKYSQDIIALEPSINVMKHTT